MPPLIKMEILSHLIKDNFFKQDISGDRDKVARVLPVLAALIFLSQEVMITVAMSRKHTSKTQ